MSTFLSSLITSNDITKEQQQATHRMLRNILIILIVATSFISIVDGLVFNHLTTLFALVPLAIISLISLIYLQRQVLWPARIIIPFGSLISIGYIIFIGNGLHDVGISSLALVVILAGLTLGSNGLIIFGVLTALTVTLIGMAEMNGYVPNGYGEVGISDIVIISTAVLVGAFLLRLLLNHLQQTISQIKISEQDQRKANVELLELKESLENRVVQRTTELSLRGRELETANIQIQRRAAQFEALAQVSQSIASVHELNELLPHVATVISEHYGFYHVGLFLLDETNEYAVFVASNSAGGKTMVDRQHRLKVGEQGIVGSVAGSGKPRIALDVGSDAVFFNNPDLPDTHSEMALPLVSGEKIIGVLDVQSIMPGAFTNEDMETISLLASQVSLAIENARLFNESKNTLLELQLVMRQSTREAWKRLPEQQNILGYRYSPMGATQLSKPFVPAIADKGSTKDGETGEGTFVVPIELRGEVIGTLVVQSPTGEAWNKDEQDIIKAVAERVAFSAENARLFEETTQRAERERLVSEITGKIRGHNDPQAMIETAINELRNALGATRVQVIPQSTSEKDM